MEIGAFIVGAAQCNAQVAIMLRKLGCQDSPRQLL
ncbi:MAG: hypothetical protein RLZZ103_1030 [Pseudomonadota bacterium]|jgi:hypothetical protein